MTKKKIHAAMTKYVRKDKIIIIKRRKRGEKKTTPNNE